MTLTEEERITVLEKWKSARDRWEAEHDGRTNAWWDAQHTWNEKADHMHSTINARLSAIERKIMWVTGFAAALGAVAGNILSNLQLIN